MRTFRVMLVAVRNLGAGRNAVVERAAQIAAGCGARLELFHDLSMPIYVDTQLGSGESLADLTRATRGTALGRLERIAEPLRASPMPVLLIKSSCYRPRASRRAVCTCWKAIPTRCCRRRRAASAPESRSWAP